jgi:hypothetical protein
MKARPIAYWTATALIAGETLAGGVTDLIHGRESIVAGRPVVDVVTQLGYPLYVLTILGILKLAGAAVLLAPGLPRLKEWAYAGVTFELTGAAASHALRGNSTGELAPPLVLAAFALASWGLRPPSRTLKAVSPGTPSSSRLVASTRTPGQRWRTASTSRAHASMTCSQLSSTSSARLGRRC